MFKKERGSTSSMKMQLRQVVIKVIRYGFILWISMVLVKPGFFEPAEKIVRAEEKGGKKITIANFSDGETFFDNWKSFKKIPKEQFRLNREDSYPYLAVTARGNAVPIAKEERFDPREFQLLVWKWRVIELPQKGKESMKERSDSAAGIYVIFSNVAKNLLGLNTLKKFWRFPSLTPDMVKPETIKYVWSASLDIGHTTESPYSKKTKIIVLQNHTSPLNRWVTEKVNIYEDYKRLFKDEPSQVYGIGLLTDADNTQSQAVAHYGGIVRKKPVRSHTVQSHDFTIADRTQSVNGDMHHVNQMNKQGGDYRWHKD